MFDVNFFEFYSTKSMIHNINPFFKIVCMFVFSVLILFFQNILFHIFLVLIMLILIYLTSVPYKFYLHQLMFLLPLLILASFFSIIFGSSYITLIIVNIKLLLIFIYYSMLIFTTKLKDIDCVINLVVSPLRNSRNFKTYFTNLIEFIPLTFKKVNNSNKYLSQNVISDRKIFSYIITEYSLLFYSFSNSTSQKINRNFILKLRSYGFYNNIYDKFNIGINDEIYILSHVLLIFVYVFLEVLI